MPRRAEREIIERNRSIHGLGLILDPRRFRQRLQAELPGHKIEGVERRYIRFKPGMNCLVGYRVMLDGEALDLHAKAFSSDSAEKLDKSERRAIAPSHIGVGRLIWHDQAVVVNLLPNDNKMRNLKCIGSEQARQKLLHATLPHVTELQQVAWEQLNYKPERRYVARLVGKHRQAVIKFFAERGFASALANARWLSQHDAGFFPALLGHNLRRRVLLSEWVEGKVLVDLINDPQASLEAVTQTGELLARFHAGAPVQPERYHALDEAPQRLTEHAETIAELQPGLASMARDLAAQLIDGLAEDCCPMQRIHGDFYAKQVVYTGEKAVLLDLDEVCVGRAGMDLGLFIAHLRWDQLRGRLAPNRALEAERALLAGYRQVAGGDASALSRLHLYIAVGLFQLGHHPFRNCLPQWPGLTRKILKQAAELVRRPAGTAARSPVAELLTASIGEQIRQDPAFSGLLDALNPPVMQQLLLGVDAMAGRVLQSVRPIRHRPGRRCVIEYPLVSQAAQEDVSVLVGKLRARGADRRTYHLNQQLYDAGFGSKSTDRVRVPRPIALFASNHLWLQQKVPGVAPFDLLLQPGGEQVARQIARALYQLHRAPCPLAREHTLDDELQILEKQLVRYVGADERVQSLLAGCHQLVTQATPGPVMTVHRDFYHDQLLVDGDTLYLLDLDLVCRGDPAVDLGNFIAHVQEQCLRLFDDATRADAALDALVQEYLLISGQNGRERVDLYTTLSLVRLVAISQRIEQRQPFTRRLIAHCEQRPGLTGFEKKKRRFAKCALQ